MSGIMPATKAMVVMRIGRNRSRFACRIASARGIPCRRKVSVWSTCRMPFFFTTPKSTKMPSMLNMSSDWPSTFTEIIAKGRVSGSDEMIEMGSTHDSNCAASTR